MRGETKKCLKCKKTKSLADYYRDKSTKDGHTRRCMKCLTEDRWERREYNKNYQTVYRTLNEEVLRERARTAHNRRNPASRMLMQAKSRAKRLGIPFNIDITDIIIPDKCPILGLSFKPGIKGDYEQTSSLDRIDSLKGYVKGNVWVISSKANTMKSNATKEQLLTFANSIINYFSDDIVQTN